jgi:hypothetical protein
MKSILDPAFHYRSSVETDLRKTFAKVRRAQRRQEQKRPAIASPATPPKVLQLRPQEAQERR